PEPDLLGAHRRTGGAVRGRRGLPPPLRGGAAARGPDGGPARRTARLTRSPQQEGVKHMTQALRLSRSDPLRFPTGAKCIAYLRVSTERQAHEKNVTFAVQLDA